jgi:hypothetical protein
VGVAGGEVGRAEELSQNRGIDGMVVMNIVKIFRVKNWYSQKGDEGHEVGMSLLLLHSRPKMQTCCPSSSI